MAEKSHTERAGQLFRALLVVECRAELSHLAHLGPPPVGEIWELRTAMPGMPMAEPGQAPGGV